MRRRGVPPAARVVACARSLTYLGVRSLACSRSALRATARLTRRAPLMDAGNPDRLTDPGPFRFDPDESAALAVARARVLERIELAARRAGREVAEVRLVAVSKTVAAGAAACRRRGRAGHPRREPGPGGARQGRTRCPARAGTWSGRSSRTRRAGPSARSRWSSRWTPSELAVRLDRLAAELRPGRRFPILLAGQRRCRSGQGRVRARRRSRRALPRLLALAHLDVRGLMTVGRLVAGPGGGTADVRRPCGGSRRRSAGASRSSGPSCRWG